MNQIHTYQLARTSHDELRRPAANHGLVKETAPAAGASPIPTHRKPLQLPPLGLPRPVSQG